MIRCIKEMSIRLCNRLTWLKVWKKCCEHGNEPSSSLKTFEIL
jgi:hypothetical protein